MEFNFASFPLLFSFFLLIIFITKQVKESRKTLKLPPGPRTLPIIGNLHNLIGPLPHRTLRNLAQKHGPIMHLKFGEVSVVVLSSPEMAKVVLKEHDMVFSNRPYNLATQVLGYGATGVVFSSYDDYWRQIRKICVMELMSAKRVQSFRTVREEVVGDMVKSIYGSKGSPVNLSKMLYSMTYGITARLTFGKKLENEEEFIKMVAEANILGSGFTVPDMYPSIKFLHTVSGVREKLNDLHRRVDVIAEGLLQKHRDSNERSGEIEDLVDVLIRLQKEGDLQFPLTDDNIKAVFLDIITAGSETSSAVIEWAISELIRNPTIMKKAQEEVRRVYTEKGDVEEAGLGELNYLSCIIRETLRLHPPTPLLIPRESNKACEINGYYIPAKSKIMTNAWAIGRDPTLWDEPEIFKPERFLESELDFKGRDFEYIPFGAGRRICPGILFAVANMELPLANLLFHFDWKLPKEKEHEGLDVDEFFGVTVSRKNNLVLVPVPYKTV